MTTQGADLDVPPVTKTTGEMCQAIENLRLSVHAVDAAEDAAHAGWKGNASASFVTTSQAWSDESVFGSCHGSAEIVAYAHIDGVAVRAPAAIAVHDTGRGRIVAAPMVSPDRRVWSTITTGSNHRIIQAVGSLIEGLPGERWLPP
ncbi:ESX secretion-associated protein EspG [Nocardia carnea]|uniref:ESX secretion-associated protein EspG n=1 Tax=Nocardia carnea TaxID=37328 RepID=UPI002456E31D|nr:ESX secretion-associated protein EspG [Nocardia carnea]